MPWWIVGMVEGTLLVCVLLSIAMVADYSANGSIIAISISGAMSILVAVVNQIALQETLLSQLGTNVISLAMIAVAVGWVMTEVRQREKAKHAAFMKEVRDV